MEEADEAAELEPIDFTISELEDVNLVGFSNDQDLLQVVQVATTETGVWLVAPKPPSTAVLGNAPRT